MPSQSVPPSPNALQRAAELGDGFICAGSLSTAKFADEVKVLRALLSEAGYDPTVSPIAKRAYIAVNRDKARAGKRLTEWFGAFYGRSPMAEEVSVWGSAAECADGLAKVAAALARHDVSNPSWFPYDSFALEE